jgi:membrane-associated protein
MLTIYGLPVLFMLMALVSLGMPFPSSLTLVAVGSFVAQGDLQFWPVIAVGTAGAVVGDQVGYAIGFWGGRPLVNSLTRRIGGADRMAAAEAFARKWAGVGVFFSRWLIGPLGPWINVTSGISGYPWRRFVMLDVAGELIWLLLYVSLGRLFSDQVQAIADLLGNLTWVVVGLLAVVLIGWSLFKQRSVASSSTP